ncbi:uncharacterized protein [Centruroides vittatus]|uniref:uncharacterized protein n=1 Tax=Centruroides vittatus TaxID=120091 RepID=UPI00350EF3B0
MHNVYQRSNVASQMENLREQSTSVREFHQFPELSSIKDDVTLEDIGRFSSHLNELKFDMEERFEDIMKLRVYDWKKKFFTANIEEANRTCQEELLEIRYDVESKHKFDSGGYENLWQNKKNSFVISKYVENDIQFIDTFSYLISCGIGL